MLLLLFICFLSLLSRSYSISRQCSSSAHETLFALRSIIRDDTLKEGQQPTSALVFVPRGKPITTLSAALAIALSPPAGDGFLSLNISNVMNRNISKEVIDVTTLAEADVQPGGTLTDRRLVELQKLVGEMYAMTELTEPGKRRVAVIVHDVSELSSDGLPRLNLLNRLLDGRTLVTDVDFRASSKSSRKAFKAGELSLLVIIPWDNSTSTSPSTIGDEKINISSERRSANTVAIDYLQERWIKAIALRELNKEEKENRPINLDALLGRLRSNVIVLSETLRIINEVGGGVEIEEEEERRKMGCKRSDLKVAAEALLTDELSYKGLGRGNGRKNKGKGRNSSSNLQGKTIPSEWIILSVVIISTGLIAVAVYCMCVSNGTKTREKDNNEEIKSIRKNEKEIREKEREETKDELISTRKQDETSPTLSKRLEKNINEVQGGTTVIRRQRGKSTSEKNRMKS